MLQLALNDGHGRFDDASCALAAALPEPQVYRGAAFGDVDGDGDVDAYVVVWNGRGRLLRNDAARAGSWLQLDLVRADGERGGVGAVVVVEDDTGRVQVRDVVTGTGYLSHSSLTVELGLGRARAVRRLEVAWPGGRRQRFPVAGLNRRVVLVEGNGSADAGREK